MRVVRAFAVLTGEGAPIRDGAVVVDESGCVVDVGRASDIVTAHPGAPVTEVRGVVMPGLVNAHVHLELSALRGKVSGGAGFVPWVDRLLDTRPEVTPEEEEAAISAAVDEIDRSGTTAVGDVSNTLAAAPLLARRGIGGAVFHEVFGVDRDRALARTNEIARLADSGAFGWRSVDLVWSPAPHTLYTTHPDAVRALVDVARRLGVRTSLHLAEHPAERAFLMHGSGPFADFARRRCVPIEGFPIPNTGPIDRAANLGVLSPDVLAVHLTDASAEELERVAHAGAPVVLCPRSNLYIETRLPPLPDLLKAGLVPALGTDSLASNVSLDLLAEARALRDRFRTLPATTLIEMATLAGARALGRSDLGRIAKGARPGVLAIEGALSSNDDPAAWALTQPAQARRWIVRRQPAHREGDSA